LVRLISQGRSLYMSLLPSQTLQITSSLQIILEGPEAPPPPPPPAPPPPRPPPPRAAPPPPPRANGPVS
jgi:hypothetical protein